MSNTQVYIGGGQMGHGKISESTLGELSEPKAASTGLLRGEEYNFKHQPADRLIYIGKKHNWHQFERIGSRGVWCELLDTDLHLIEKTVAA